MCGVCGVVSVRVVYLWGLFLCGVLCCVCVCVCVWALCQVCVWCACVVWLFVCGACVFVLSVYECEVVCVV